MLQKPLFTLILLFLWNNIYSQSDSLSKYQLGMKSGYGFIITHSPNMEYVTEQHISKFEVYGEKNTFGSKEWHQHLGFPKVGVSFSYFDFNNKDIGKGYSLTPYLNFQLLGKGKFRLNIKPAISVGYISQPFDIESNFKNAAIGSHFNIFFSVLAEAEIQLFKDMGLLVGANFSHFSNTGFKSPNLGINIPTIETGLFHRFGPQATQNINKESAFDKKKSLWTINLSSGLNEIVPPGGKKYLATALSIAREKRISFNSSIAGSLDLFYNPAIIDRLEESFIYIDEGYENLQIGISFNHILHIGKLQSCVQFGYYLKSVDEELGRIYQIVCGRYYISPRFDALLLFKTHLAKAEYLMGGIGIKLGKNEK